MNFNQSENADPIRLKKIEFAKNFESIFINKLLDTMQETVGQWGFEKDGASNQIQGLFNHYLSEEISEQGGMGLWKEFYNNMFDEPTSENIRELDQQI